MNVALFGFMGVGKSEVGRILAERLGLEFTDMDEEVERRAGKPIPTIFEEGEAAFRELERAIAEEASARDGQVIACGGGTVINPVNLRNLRGSSVMVLLTADVDTILRRLEGDAGSRPLLRGGDRPRRVLEILSDRREAYLAAADILVDTSHKTPAEVADEILLRLREAGPR